MSKELNEDQLAELRDDLLHLQEQLREMLAQDEASKPVQLDQQLVGRLSRMDAIQQQEMAKANRQQSERRRVTIRRALESIAKDDYGFCHSCDEPIGYPRLKARPDTPLCLRCQEGAERDH